MSGGRRIHVFDVSEVKSGVRTGQDLYLFLKSFHPGSQVCLGHDLDLDVFAQCCSGDALPKKQGLSSRLGKLHMELAVTGQL